jgi:hypothetical protein
MVARARPLVMVALGATIHAFATAGTDVDGRPSPTMTREERAIARSDT